MKPPVGKEINPRGYTDLAVVVGPLISWVQDDYVDLARAYPEVFLGYRILLLNADMLPRAIRGREVHKIVVLEGDYSWKRREQLERAADYAAFMFDAKIEHWRVHRGLGIVRVG